MKISAFCLPSMNLYARLFDGLSLRTKGLIVVAIPLTSLLAATVSFYWLEAERQSADAMVRHTFEVRAEIQKVYTLLADAEGGTRGYLLVRREEWLQPLATAERMLLKTLEHLRTLDRDNAAQVERLSRLKFMAESKLQLMAALRNPARSEIAAGLETSKAVMDDLRGELAAMQNREDRLLSERTKRADNLRARISWAMAIVGAFGLSGGLLAAVLFSTGVVRRIQRLAEEMCQLAHGQPLRFLLPGRDEIGALEKALAETSDLLVERASEIRRAQELLESRVYERTAELARANEALRDEIVEREQAEQALAASETRYRDLIDNAADLIYTHDLFGNLTSINRAAEQITGYRQDEALKMNIAQIVAEEYKGSIECELNGEPRAAYELEIVAKNGRRVALEVSTQLITQGEVPVGVQGIARDVTARKHLEEQFRHSQKMEAVGRLAGGIAHDFNNLLTVIIGYTQMLLEKLRPGSEFRSDAEAVLKAASRASMLTYQLLAFSRRQMIKPRVLDLNSIVGEVESLLRRVIGEDIELVSFLSPGLARVRAEPGQIEQVLMNLVVNARDAMPHGGRITIETAHADLGENYAHTHLEVKPGRYVMLAVSDTGIGMDAETQSRLFEPFFTTKGVDKGTGLGLSTVFGIIKQNGGNVWVYSELSKGTTFKIYLPQVEEMAEFAEPAPPSSRPQCTETILLAEDEEAVRKLVRDLLSKQGYQVLTADGGSEAIKLSEEHQGPIQLLLTDAVMPNINGRQLAQLLAPARPGMRVLYMSGYTDNVIVHHGVLDCGTTLLQKPFTSEALARVVRKVLDAPVTLLNGEI